jgi:LuxR family maltose regulon positive regulatory protein
LPASIANARAYRAQALGDFASTITYAQQALALLPQPMMSMNGARLPPSSVWLTGLAAMSRPHIAPLLRDCRAFQKLGGIQITSRPPSFSRIWGWPRDWLRDSGN